MRARYTDKQFIEALEKLQGQEKPGDFFIHWYTARKIALEVGCSEGTAFNRLKQLKHMGVRTRLGDQWGNKHRGFRLERGQ